MSNAVLTPVRTAHRFDTEALARYLRASVPAFGDDLVIEQFDGGQSNPTFRLTAGGKRYVLRKQPPGELLPSAHQVDREHRVMHALAGSGVELGSAPRIGLATLLLIAFVVPMLQYYGYTARD